MFHGVSATVGDSFGDLLNPNAFQHYEGEPNWSIGENKAKPHDIASCSSTDSL